MARQFKRPNRGQLAKIAENQPELLNLLVAYFVMEWQEVRLGKPPRGVDQCGVPCLIPNYIRMWTDGQVSGVDVALHYLELCPSKRQMKDPGFISYWLHEVSQ